MCFTVYRCCGVGEVPDPQVDDGDGNDKVCVK